MKSEIRNQKSEIALRPLPGAERGVRGRGRALAFRHSSFVIRISALIAFVCFSHSALACSVCFGNSDSKLTQGMLAGVLVLLLVVVSVLGGFVALFVFLARRAAAVAALDKESTELKA